MYLFYFGERSWLSPQCCTLEPYSRSFHLPILLAAAPALPTRLSFPSQLCFRGLLWFGGGGEGGCSVFLLCVFFFL